MTAITTKEKNVMGAKVNLILGSSGAGKSHYIYEELVSKSLNNPDKNYIIIVPEQFTMSVQREIVKRHPGNGVMNVDIVSFGRLAFRVFEELGIGDLSVLDDTGKTLILRKVIENQKDNLKVYKNKLKMPGFVEEMKSAISEMYSYGITKDNFDDISERMKDKPFVCAKLNDIGAIYNSFNEYMGEKYITKEEILDRLCSVVRKSKLIKESELIFDGFTGFTPVQYKLIKLLIECSRDMTITVTIPKVEAAKVTKLGFLEVKEQELFNMSKTTINKIISLCADNNVLINDIKLIDNPSNYRHSVNKEMAMLEENIFRKTSDSILYDKNENVKIVSATNPLKECEFVAKYISEYVRDKGYRYRDFAIISGDMEIYGKTINTYLEKYNIPHFIDNKRSLLLNPCVVAIRATLEIIDDNFGYESVFRFLKCNVTDIPREDIDIFENYILAYGIRGHSAYDKPFRKRKKMLDESMLPAINETRVKFMDIMGELYDTLKAKDITVRQMSIALYNFVEKININKTIEKYIKKFEEEKELSLCKEYQQTYRNIIELFDKIVELLGDEKISLKEYRQILDDGFREIKVGIIPLSVDSVVVGDVERTRLADVKVLFVVGANDGIIPKHSGKSGLLSQSDRGYLKKLEIELSPTDRESIFIQKFYLYLNLTKPTQELVVTYAHNKNDGKSIRPSYLVNALKSLYNSFEENEADQYDFGITTKENALYFVAENIQDTQNVQEDKLINELISYFYLDEEKKKMLDMIIEGAFYNSNPNALDKVVAKALYGEEMIKSVSRLEKYASCAYAHFLTYGLKLARRQVYEINASDIGNVYHKVIETFSMNMRKSGYDFRTITKEQSDIILDKSIEMIASDEGNEIFVSSRRNEYLLGKIKEVSAKSIWAIKEHVKAGNFNPKNFELSYSQGRIDRIDTYVEDDTLYVKIIDYKSGKKTFDIEEVLAGLQMQLVYYAGAAIDIEKAKQKGGKEVLPAGALYFNIKSPYIDRNKVKDEEDLKNKLLKEYKMSGMVNSDKNVVENMDLSLSDGAKFSNIIPIKSTQVNTEVGNTTMSTANFIKLIEYVRNKADDMCVEIINGNIAQNPYKKSLHTSCDYCVYKGVCMFDEKQSGNKYRKLCKLNSQDITKEIGGEARGEVD